jgi:hypothetical protein
MKAAKESSTRRVTGILLALGLVALASADRVHAQQRDEYGDVNASDVSYQTVARISYLSGNVSFARGDDPDNWQAADQNVPMSVGDRIYADARSRVELESDGGDVIRVGARSELSALNLTADTKQFAVRSGIVSFHVGNIDDNDVFEVDTPNSAITFQQAGDYRVEVDESGNSRVIVQRGNVLLAAGGGQIGAHRGEEIRVDGIDSPRYDVINIAARGDGWDQWVDGRTARSARATSYQYVNADVVGAADLDEAGRWQDIPEYGHVWAPTAVAVDWAPYRVGHWGWQDPWGWTWISAEPWGWAPYHYGRWVVYSSRWYWVPVAPTARYVTYAPACVAFVGGGPGFSASITVGGGGFVGWFPLGPRDPFNPWWGPRAASVNVTNVTYVNRTYVTVVNQNTFVSGGVVTTNIVRDRTVVNQVAAAQVVRGPLPVVPTVGALRVASRANLSAPLRPPAAMLARPVVARVAPPPAPPTFQAKMAVIKENHGAPIAPAAAATLSIKERGRAQAMTTIKPAASDKVTLAPRTGSATASATKVESVKEMRGRPLATSQQPVASSPVTVSTGRGREAHAAQGGVVGPSGATTTTTTVDRGRAQTNFTAPTPGRPVVTEQKKTTPDTGRQTHNQDFHGRPQPTPAPQVAVPQNQSQTRSREVDQGQHRQRPTPPPTPRPQSNMQNQSNTQQSGRGREQSVDQGHARPTPVPPPQNRERSSAGPPPSPKPQPQSDQRGRQHPPEKEKTKNPNDH